MYLGMYKLHNVKMGLQDKEEPVGKVGIPTR